MTFTRICATFLALAAVAQAALVINSVNVIANGTSTVIFTSTDPENDPTSFTMELTNPDFNDEFAVGNNIPSTSKNFTFQTPSITAGPNYAIRLVQNNNDSTVFAMSPPFVVAQNDATSSTSSKPSASATPTVPPSLGSGSTTPSATIPSVSPSGVTSQSGSSPSSGSGSSSSFTAPPSTSTNPVFNGGASSLQVPFSLLLVSVAFAFL